MLQLLDSSLVEYDQTTLLYRQNDLLRSYCWKEGKTKYPEQIEILKERYVQYFLKLLEQKECDMTDLYLQVSLVDTAALC